MPPRAFRVLLTDYIGYDSGVEMPYLLTQAGCVVDVFSAPRSWLLRNKYWDTWFRADTSDPEAFGGELERIVQEGNYDWVIPVDDMVLRIMNDRITDETLFYKILPLSKIENRAFLGSKIGLSQFAEKYGIETPSYILYENLEQVSAIGEKLGYPVIVKIDRSQGGDGVFKCKDTHALRACVERIPESERSNLIFQKCIQGQTVSCEVLYRDGFLLAYAPSTMEVMYGDDLGISVVRKYTPQRDLEPLLVAIGQSLGANGFGNSTFVYEEETQKYYFIELDLRPQVWFTLDRFAGVDFSQAAANFLTNTYLTLRPTMREDEPVYIRHFVRDIMYSFKKKDIRNLLMWMFNLDGRWKFIPLHDPMFLLAIARQAPITVLNKIASFFSKQKTDLV